MEMLIIVCMMVLSGYAILESNGIHRWVISGMAAAAIANMALSYNPLCMMLFIPLTIGMFIKPAYNVYRRHYATH